VKKYWRQASGSGFGLSIAQLIVEAQHVPLIEDAIADVLSNPKLKSDGLHPNAEGHARLAEKTYKELQSIGYAG